MAILRIVQKYSSFCSIRNYSKQPNYGFLFDIDGVIVRGKNVLPSARAGFKNLVDSDGKFKIPTVFVTNSGNALRSERAEDLTNWLGIKVDENQVVLAHSPLTIFHQLKDKNVLISGQGRIKEIALDLGFQKIVTMDELVQNFPSLDYINKNKRNPTNGPVDPNFKSIEGIILLSEPINWETSLQLLVDLLITNGMPSHNPTTIPYPHIPLIACNMDLLWVSEAPIPRYGHGALLCCLESVYKKVTNLKLNYTALVGKPSLITYHYAYQKLVEHAKSIGVNEDLKTLYAIGDNVNTDIYGANFYNKHLSGFSDFRDSSLYIQDLVEKNKGFPCTLKKCESMLVETGVYQPDSKLNVHHSQRDFLPLREALCEPKFISKDVKCAIEVAIQNEQH